MTLAATMWHPDGWGSRARMGLLTPHNDIVPEGEFRALAPDDVSIHVARVPLGWRSGPEPPPIGLDAARAFAQPPHIDDAAELLSATAVSVIAYAFTSSGYLLGSEGDAALKRRLEARTHGIPVVLPCPAVTVALRALGVRRLALIHPPWYPAELDRLGTEYFRSAGLEVVYAAAAEGLPRTPLSVEPAQVYEWVRAHVPQMAEAVFIGGGGLRAIGTIQALEDALKCAVLTANQVIFWHALRLARVEAQIGGYGQIFRRELPPST
jgi:maleate isomerase